MSDRAATLLAFGLVLIAAIALEVAARLGVLRFEPLAQVTRRLRGHALGRIGLLVGWAWVTWHLLAR